MPIKFLLMYCILRKADVGVKWVSLMSRISDLECRVLLANLTIFCGDSNQ